MGRVCPICGRFIRSMGIASHRAMHWRAHRRKIKEKEAENLTLKKQSDEK